MTLTVIMILIVTVTMTVFLQFGFLMPLNNQADEHINLREAVFAHSDSIDGDSYSGAQ